MKKHIPYSAIELAWIKLHRAWSRPKAHAKFCKKFGRTDVGIDNYHGLCKRKGWLTGRTGRFEKGQVSHNAGKKCAPGKMGNHPNARRSQFKKGNLPHNTNYLGHERVNVDGYVEISVDQVNPHTGFERRYVHKHRYLWEQKNGKIPADMVLKCLSDDTTNCDLSNWECIPRAALPFLNGHRGYNYSKMPAELRPTVLALAKVRARKALKKTQNVRSCRKCGCTDADCRQCIKAQGFPCSWAEADLCTRCVSKTPKSRKKT